MIVLLLAAVAVCLTVERIRTPLVAYVTQVYVQITGNQGGTNANQNADNTGNDTPKPSGSGTQRGDIATFVGVPTLSGEDLSIHFLELGNQYTGDCTYLKIGDVDILIDAGSRTTSAAAIVPYLRRYCTDGKLEYVIVTHAHQDHIAGFVGSKSNPGVFDSFEVGTIIEFTSHIKDTATYTNYCTERDEAVARGATLYTALQCYNQTGGAQRVYTLAAGVSMEILYNYYYDHEADSENDYSVCTLFSAGDKHFLFTGDLEKKGEAYLVQYNNLPKVELFKGGHHGSYTANTAGLMAVIQPKVVCVCCCCGTPEYTSNADNMFPSQSFFDNVLPYTHNIFVTTMSVWDGQNTKKYSYASCNGNIVVLTNQMVVYCSADDTPVPNSTWFSQHRVDKTLTTG